MTFEINSIDPPGEFNEKYRKFLATNGSLATTKQIFIIKKSNNNNAEAVN